MNIPNDIYYDNASLIMDIPVTLVLLTYIEVTPRMNSFQSICKCDRLYIPENYISVNGRGSFVREGEYKPRN